MFLDPISCVGTGQIYWSKSNVLLISVYVIVATAFLGVGILIGDIMNQQNYAASKLMLKEDI